jgi:hypothetical protein
MISVLFYAGGALCAMAAADLSTVTTIMAKDVVRIPFAHPDVLGCVVQGDALAPVVGTLPHPVMPALVITGPHGPWAFVVDKIDRTLTLHRAPATLSNYVLAALPSSSLWRAAAVGVGSPSEDETPVVLLSRDSLLGALAQRGALTTALPRPSVRP